MNESDIVWDAPNDGDIVWDKPDKKRPRSVTEQFTGDRQPQLRQLGIAARQGLEGLAGVVGIGANPLGAAWNLTAGKLGAPRLGNNLQESTANLLDRIGLPKEESELEKTLGFINRIVAGGGGVIKGAQLGTGAIATALSSSPGAQLASMVSGGAASEGARHAGASPGWQTAAGLLGAFGPSLAIAGGAGAVRSLLRGPGEGNADLYNLHRLEWGNAGRSPTVGQASGHRVPQAFETLLSRTPGAAGTFAKEVERGAAQMKQRVDDIANGVARNADPAAAGRAIEKGTEEFVKRFKLQQNVLYGKVDAYVPSDTRVSVGRTSQALADLNADIPSAPELSKFFKNSTILALEKALKSDVDAAGTIPYEALKKVRSLVGEAITNKSLSDMVPRSKWKALYAALSDDMGEAAAAAGPNATKAWERANWFTRAGYDRIEGVLDKVASKDTAEQIYNAAISGAKDGATTINSVYRSLLPAERRVVTASVINRLGKATPGTQNQVGDIFSSETFLTNWNKISDPAKRMLFADSAARRGLDDLALASERIRAGSKVFANPSGTATGVTHLGLSGVVFSGILGRLDVAASILTAMGAANVSAKLMTNPGFVSWVGRTTRVSPAMLPAALNTLAQQSQKWDDDDAQATSQFIEAMKQ